MRACDEADDVGFVDAGCVCPRLLQRALCKYTFAWWVLAVSRRGFCGLVAREGGLMKRDLGSPRQRPRWAERHLTWTSPAGRSPARVA